LDVSLETVSICTVKADGSAVWEGKASGNERIAGDALNPVSQANAADGSIRRR
jgi:hypothetical protein